MELFTRAPRVDPRPRRPLAASPRGVAGTLVVHKAAGAAAAAGESLEKVAAAARAASDAVKTMGAAYEVCTLPGRPPSGRLGSDEVELGLGIHGEPGAARAPTMTASELAAHLVSKVCPRLPKASGPVALIINDLGAATPMELAIFGAACVRAVEAKGYVVSRILTGALMTALDMHGVSLSVAALDDALTKALDAPCRSPAMQTGAFKKHEADEAPLVAPDAAAIADAMPPAVKGDLEDSDRAATVAKAAAQAVLAAEAELTALDEKVGDGDCGTTLAQGATAILAAVDAGLPAGASGVAAALSGAVAGSMGGSSGVLYDLGLKAAEKSLRETAAARRSGAWSRAEADAAWAAAFVAFADAVSRCGGAGLGSRTMCDATLPAAAVLKAGNGLAKAAAAARLGADATAQLVATHGRTAYLSAADQTVVDPGAHAVAIAMAAAARALAA